MTVPTTNRKGVFGQPPRPWNPMPFMDEYLLNLQVDGRSKDYIRTVKGGLSRFADFCHAEGLFHPGEIQREHILRFQAHLMGQPISISYRQQVTKYVRGYINWLITVRHITQNPWYGIRVGRITKKPNPLEDEEVEALFAAHKQQAFAMPPFTWHRREVILALLYGWGLRIHELHSLNLTQMDIRLDWVQVINKGGGTKTLPYADAMKNSVQRYVRHRPGRIGEDALLVDREGKRLSIQMIRKIVTELGERSGVPVNPHRLRDTCGTNLLDDDVPIERVMKILGHTNLGQTRTYARVNNPKVKESHDASMNPRLNILLNAQRTGDLL